MATYKIIFAGPVGAGKTTAIETLSDIATVSTDKKATDMTLARKSQTTVAMDYGVMKINDTEQIHLYGTPGQERFDFMWEILVENGIGLILLLDNSRTTAIQDMHFFIGAFRKFIDESGVAIGITHTDTDPSPTVGEYQQALKTLGLAAPVFEVDARNHQDMTHLVRALLYSIDPSLSTESSLEKHV